MRSNLESGRRCLHIASDPERALGARARPRGLSSWSEVGGGTRSYTRHPQYRRAEHRPAARARLGLPSLPPDDGLGPVPARIQWRNAVGSALPSQWRASPRCLHLEHLAGRRLADPWRRAGELPVRPSDCRASLSGCRAELTCLRWRGGHPTLVRCRTNGCASGFGGCRRGQIEGAELLGAASTADTELHTHPAHL